MVETAIFLVNEEHMLSNFGQQKFSSVQSININYLNWAILKRTVVMSANEVIDFMSVCINERYLNEFKVKIGQYIGCIE